MSVRRRVLAACVTAVLALAGCSRTPAPEAAGPAGTSEIPTASTAPPAAPPEPDAAVPAGLAGTGCANYAARVPAGPGSLSGMGRDPVAVAVSNSALLTTLAGAISGKLNPDVDLTAALNAGQFTVFAPTDEAFGRLDPATVEKLKTDDGLLTAVLKYHVVEGQTEPDQLPGEHKTLQGAPLTVTGSGGDMRVNGAAVLCGAIKTANATVYLVDTVLMPPPPAPPAPPATSTTTTPAS